MSNFTKNLLGLVASIVAVVGVLWGIGYTLTHYIDSHYGDGTSGIFFIFMAAVVLTMAIVTITMFLTNRTHASAGDDIVAVVGGLKRSFDSESRYGGQLSVINAKMQHEGVRTIEGRRRLDDRLLNRIDQRELKRQWQIEDQSRNAQQNEQATDAYWEMVDQGAGDVYVYDD